MCANDEKVVYLSEAVATNAATLHQMAHAGCAGVVPYLCSDATGDHWHIGHRTRAEGDWCKTNFPSTRPRRIDPRKDTGDSAPARHRARSA